MSASKRMNALLAVAASQKPMSAPTHREIAAANALVNMKAGSAPTVVSVSSHPLSASPMSLSQSAMAKRMARAAKKNNNVIVNVPATMFASPKTKASSPIVSVPAGMFNVNESGYKVMVHAPYGRNTKGRIIAMGPKGGAYVLVGNKKVYTFRRANSPPTRRGRKAGEEMNTGEKNAKGRVIYKGPSGGRYIKTNKGKRYLKK